MIAVKRLMAAPLCLCERGFRERHFRDDIGSAAGVCASSPQRHFRRGLNAQKIGFCTILYGKLHGEIGTPFRERRGRIGDRLEFKFVAKQYLMHTRIIYAVQHHTKY
jgi:hypothetical protein